MRELKMLQTQKKEASRPKLNKSRKISPKSLVDALDSVAEEMSPTKSMDSTTLSSISLDREAESESFNLLDPDFPDLSEMSIHSDLTCFSEITSVENVKREMDNGFDGIGDLKISSLEVQIAVKVLRKAVTEILNVDCVDFQSKKLLCGLVEMVVEILEPVPEGKDRISEILAMKTRIVSCFFLLCVFATFAAHLLLGSGSRSSYGKPPPT